MSNTRPTEVDWRLWCTPVKNQGNCGSCTSFGTCGAWEARIKIKADVINMDIDLSERDLFFCAGGSCGQGSWPEAVLDRAVHGICLESCCPYHDLDQQCGVGRCDDWWVEGKRLQGYNHIQDIEKMKDLIAEGPIPGTMAVHQSFFNYVSGVYHSLPDNDPIVGYHMIAVVGYSESRQAWLVKNSWGTGWGMSGYVWIAYGDSEIDNMMYEIILDGDIPPEPNPTPSPCPLGNGFAKFLNYSPVKFEEFAKIINPIPYLFQRKGRFFFREGKYFYLNP